MNGIIFFSTNQLKEIVEFYILKLKCQIWLKQEDCTILKHGNMLFGFCQREHIEKEGIICFFYKTKAEVDQMYDLLSDLSFEKPKYNNRYKIYHFFAFDPEGRKIECQFFDQALPHI